MIRRSLLKSALAPSVLALSILFVAPAPAGAQPIPWRRLPAAKGLSKGQRKVAASAMRSISCYYGCSGPIARCLKRRRARATRLAWWLADYVAFLAGKSLDQAAIRKIIELRRKSSFPAKVHRIAAGSAPRLGPANAPVVIVEYADYRCRYCAKVAPLLKQLVKGMKGKVALVFKTYPLKPYGAPLRAAQAALAAQRQGKFWAMHKLLFEHQDKHDAKGLLELAKKAGLDRSKFEAAMKDRQILRRIERYKIEGLRLGVKGTPALYFNGKRYQLRKDAMHLRARAKEELYLLGK